MLVDYFLKAIETINHDRVPPYYLDTKVRDGHQFLSVSQSGLILHSLIKSEKSVNQIRYLDKTQSLFAIFPFLLQLKFVPQSKKKSRNAFQHTLRVLDKIPNDNIILKWVALFHDLGKYDSYNIEKNFIKHADYSYKLCKTLCDMYRIQSKRKICNIVRYHMEPLAYQRQPNWGKEAILRLIERCSKEDIIDIIEFAIYDKKAEHDNEEYLSPLYELQRKVERLL